MTSSSVRMILKWSVLPGEARPITAALQGAMVSTRSEPGCLGCSLTTEMGAKVTINYTEDWASERDLERQLRSERFGVLAELLEHASEPPVIQFAVGDSVRGLDYAQQIRGARSHDGI
jgi:quinol monooxygenase YgiN